MFDHMIERVAMRVGTGTGTVRPDRTAVSVRLMRAGAVFWAIAPLYVLVARPSLRHPLPPREQWGAAEAESAQLDDLVVTVGAVMILVVAGLAGWAWAVSARRLRRGPGRAPVRTVLTPLVTALVAVYGVDAIFPDPFGVRALAVLVPLLAVSLAALVITLAPERGHATGTA
ncbi:hypothetical protein ACWEQL_09615 [Kitasatospora sp. NPDC004240]